jgi:HK97 gp10 family phage protein
MSGDIKVSMDMSGFSKGINKLRGATKDNALLDAIEAGARVVQANAMINANNVFSDESTGELANSIIVETSGKGIEVEAKIGPTKIYGRIHELGGIIKPVTAKALHFVIDGVHIVTQLVHMPARPYLRPAVDGHEKEITDAIGVTLKSKIKGAINQ